MLDHIDKAVEGINRYIVECKSRLLNKLSIDVLRINRYIVECK